VTRCPHCGLVGCPCAEKLIDQWQHLPKVLAGQYAKGCPNLYDELLSEGHLALCNAALKWDASRSPRGFYKYAQQAIRWGILMELRKQGRYSQRQVQILMLARVAQRSGQYDTDPSQALCEEEANV